MCIHLQQPNNARHYNLPTVDEIAAIVPGDGSYHVRADHDIVVCLFFLHGEEGWHLNIPLQQLHENPHCFKKVTQILWYAYRLHPHPPEIEQQNLFKGHRLFKQLVCDTWTSIDQCNLTWIANKN